MALFVHAKITMQSKGKTVQSEEQFPLDELVEDPTTAARIFNAKNPVEAYRQELDRKYGQNSLEAQYAGEQFVEWVKGHRNKIFWEIFK